MRYSEFDIFEREKKDHAKFDVLTRRSDIYIIKYVLLKFISATDNDSASVHLYKGRRSASFEPALRYTNEISSSYPPCELGRASSEYPGERERDSKGNVGKVSTKLYVARSS